MTVSNKVSDSAPSLPWVMSDDKSLWTAQLPDGRMASIERQLGDDGLGGTMFVPRVGDVTGPACPGVLAAAMWAAGYAQDAR